MSIIRDEYGAIDLYSLINDDKYKLLKPFNNGRSVILYDQKKYFLKKSSGLNRIYNELIAQELAKDYGIDNAEYDLFYYNGNFGTMSLDINKPGTILHPMNEYINIRDNNLESIWNTFSMLFDTTTVIKLMDKIVDVFLFDVLIGNIDRHNDNLALIESINGYSFGTLFDNENMLSSESIYLGYYTLGVDSNDYNSNCNYNILDKFINVSDSIYLDRLISKLWIISSTNFENVLRRVEKKIGIPIHISIRNKLKVDMQSNLNMINKVISNYNKTKRL